MQRELKTLTTIMSRGNRCDTRNTPERDAEESETQDSANVNKYDGGKGEVTL